MILFLLACAEPSPPPDADADSGQPASDSAAPEAEEGVPTAEGGGSQWTDQIVINEVNPHGQPRDWIELFNPTDGDLSLYGCMLTEERGDYYKFAEATLVPAGGHYFVWAGYVDPDDGQDWSDLGLDKDGDTLALWCISDNIATLIDQVGWSSLTDDTSAARLPDGGPKWIVDDSPTPGEAND